MLGKTVADISYNPYFWHRNSALEDYSKEQLERWIQYVNLLEL